MDSATLTGLIDRVGAAQRSERRANPADRRSIHIHLPERGSAMGAEAVRLIVEANREFLGKLTKSEQRQLRTLIRKLRDRENQG